MKYMEKFPRRYFDVGISEGHAVTFAGGLAVGGKKPFVAIYSSFLQRGFDNIIHDVAIQGLPVVFCIDRAGIVGEDGVTHHGMFDLSYLRMIPGMSIAAPMDVETLRNIMLTSLSFTSPLAIRYPRGSADTAEWQTPMHQIEVGKGCLLSRREGAKIAMLSVGPIGFEMAKAADQLEKLGIMTDHYDMIWVKPLDEELLHDISANYDGIITV